MTLGRIQGSLLAQSLCFALLVCSGCESPRVHHRPFASIRPTVIGERPVSSDTEEALAEGLRLEALSPEGALGRYRDAAGLAVARGDAVVHNRAVERILRVAGTDHSRRDWSARMAAAGIDVNIMDPFWAPLLFDRLLIASDYGVSNLAPLQRRDGWGVPLIGAQSLPGVAEERPLPYRAMADEYRVATTAVARTTESGRLVVDLHNPWNEGPELAADFTTPLTMMLGHRGMRGLEYQGLFNPGFVWPRSGVFMITPYQPGKIPVLFVHGLWSSPRTWLPMINALQGDPLVRSRYQFWVALYATGHSVPVSAWRVRTSLRDLRLALDPESKDPALGRMVVVTHSLGGIIGKLLAQESGEVLQNAVFTRPLDQLAMAPSTRAFVEDVMFFRPDPAIARLVLIGVPHRGSLLANRVDALFGTAIVRRRGPGPDAIREILELNGRDVFQRDLGNQPLSGISNLQEDEPLLRAFDRMPRAPWVTWSSIIGFLEGSEDSREGLSDGVVSYRSAHLDDVPEMFVEGQHIGLNDLPATIEEVRRQLREHVGAIDTTAAGHVGPP